MRSTRTVHIVECHAGGEVGDVIVGGVAPPPGATLWEQSRFVADDDSLRRFVLNEPRGGVFRHVNLLVPPVRPEAAMGFIIMEPADTPPMSGSNSICVATVLLETGIVPMSEPESRFVLEAPGGLVDVTAQCRDGKATSVRIRNVPCFAAKLDAHLELPGYGTLKVDTAFGGDSFVVVDAAALGLRISPDEARDIAALGVRLADAASEQLGFAHPNNPDWQHISFALFATPIDRSGPVPLTRQAVAIRPGKIDRSPTGTGVSARLALLHARGEAGPGDELEARSILGSSFTGRIEETCTVGGQPAIRPSIAGQAWISGTRQLLLDPADPWPLGYRLSDTWPGAV